MTDAIVVFLGTIKSHLDTVVIAVFSSALFALAAATAKTAKRSFLRRPLYVSALMMALGGAVMALSGVSFAPATGQDVLFIVAGYHVFLYGLEKARKAPDRHMPDSQLDKHDR